MTETKRGKKERQKMKEKKYCTMCGQAYEAGDRFCQSCGEQLEVPEVPVQENRKSFGGKKIVALLVAAVIIVAGSIAGYGMLTKSYSAESVIHKTLALESGKISISYETDTGYYSDDGKMQIDFLKNKNEKTFLLQSDYDEVYISAQDGKIRVANRWDTEEYHFQDELGIDAAKLEKDLIDFFAGSVKGKTLPEGYIKNAKTERVDGNIIVTGDVADEVGLLQWIYDCYDMRQLRDVISNNISEDSAARSDFKDNWEYATDEMDDNISDLLRGLDDYGYDLGTSFKIIVNKKGVLEQAELFMEFDDFSGYDRSVEIAIKIKISDQNELERIKEPRFD